MFIVGCSPILGARYATVVFGALGLSLGFDGLGLVHPEQSWLLGRYIVVAFF